MNRPLLLLGVLVVLIALIGGGLTLWSDQDSGGDASNDAELVSQANSGAEPAAIPAPATPKKIKIKNLTPQQREKDRRLKRALDKIDRIKQVGKPVGSMYEMDEGGQKVLYAGELASGIGRNGEPLYATVQAQRVPMGEMRRRRETPEHLKPTVVNVGPITNLPGVSVPSGAKAGWQNVDPAAEQPVTVVDGEEGSGN